MFLRTVLGDVPAEAMGITLPHEHLLSDSSVWLQTSSHPYATAEPAAPNLWWMRRFPNSNRSILILDDEDLVAEELAPFTSAGGRTVVELSACGLGRDVAGLARIATRTSVNIVAGTGFYVAPGHPAWVGKASVDEIAAVMIDEIEVGVEGSDIRCGVIGEIGVSHPLHPDERAVLEAAALAQQETGAAITVHTAAHAVDEDSAVLAASVLVRGGADPTRVVMAHMDTSLHRPDYHRAVADLGCVLEYDLFGHEFFESENGFQSFGDTERVRAVAARVEEGSIDRLLLSHDICYRIQLRRFGGYGYAHLLDNIRSRLELVGVGSDAFDRLTVDNPRRIFPLRPRR